PADRSCQNHRLARADDDCAVGLLGELARLEDDLLTAHVDGNRGDAPGCESAHVRYPFTFPLCAEGGGLSQPRSAPSCGPGTRSNFHLPCPSASSKECYRRRPSSLMRAR